MSLISNTASSVLGEVSGGGSVLDQSVLDQSVLDRSVIDPKVQKTAFRVLATFCIVTAAALAAASLSGRVSAPEGLIISAALLVIAYGLILGAQYLEEPNESEIDLDIGGLSNDRSSHETNTNSSFVVDVSGSEVDVFFDAPEVDLRIIFGDCDFKGAMEKVRSLEVPYCFFKKIGSGDFFLLYRTEKGYKVDPDLAKKALDGVDFYSLLEEPKLRAFKESLHQMVLDAIKANNAKS